MSIFSKQVDNIVFEDIQELLNDKVQENIRLEYKKEIPKKDELMKKLSSMSNTHGGYTIIGIEEDGKGNPQSICGVSPRNGFKQQVVQWCFNEIYPPITPFVSNPIPHQSVKNKVVYVIYVDMSLDSPHFLTKRRGCYIRTDEFSQRFEPKLTTYEEIKFLSDRRKMGEDKRESLIERTRQRFERHKKTEKPRYYRNMFQDTGEDWNRGSFLHINLIPQFPHSKLITEHELLQLFLLSNIIKIPFKQSQSHFPPRLMYSQFESVIFPSPLVWSFSYLELNVYGQLSYFEDLEDSKEIVKDGGKTTHYIIHIVDLFSRVILTLSLGKRFYRQLGYDGRLNLRVRLENLINKKILSPTIIDGNLTNHKRSGSYLFSLLDDSMEFEIQVDTYQLKQDWEGLCLPTFRNILFSLNENETFTDDDLRKLIDLSLKELLLTRDEVTEM